MGKLKKKLQKTALYQAAVDKYRQYLLIKEFYQGKNEGDADTVVFIFDQSLPHPGLVDRLKAIVGLYYIAAENHLKFRIYLTTELRLEDYFDAPDQSHNWVSTASDINWNTHGVRFIEYKPFEQVPVLHHTKKQYHCWYYSGHNILQKMNVEKWEEKWRTLYHELFTPNARLKSLLSEQAPGGAYVAVHFRFVNALDSFEEGYALHLFEDEKQRLID